MHQVELAAGVAGSCHTKKNAVVLTNLRSNGPVLFSGGGGGAGRGGRSSGAKLDERGMARAMAALSALWSRAAPPQGSRSGGLQVVVLAGAATIDEARMQR